jgi:2-dehydropantoate 2-reductase
MHIAIMAAGSVGGYLGARLAAAGQQVSVIARGKNLEAIKANGLTVRSALGDVVAKPSLATSDPAEIGPADVLIFVVKLWDLEQAAAACKPVIGDNTVVVPFENGVEAVAALGGILGEQHVMGGVAYISAGLPEPGVVQHNGEFANFLLGNPNGEPPANLSQFAEACKKAGINAPLVPNITAQIWKKLVFFAAFSGLTAAARTNLGAIRADDDLFKVLKAAMEETAAVGKAVGAGMDDDVVEATLDTIKGMPDQIRATMAFDLDAGRKLEAYWLSGAVGRIGAAHGVPTPVHDTLYAAVKTFAQGRN